MTHAGDDIGFPGLVRCAPEMVKNVIRQVGDMGGRQESLAAIRALPLTAQEKDQILSKNAERILNL